MNCISIAVTGTSVCFKHCFIGFCWVGSKWSFEVHLVRDRCQNRRTVFLWAVGGSQVEGRVWEMTQHGWAWEQVCES